MQGGYSSVQQLASGALDFGVMSPGGGGMVGLDSQQQVNQLRASVAALKAERAKVEATAMAATRAQQHAQHAAQGSGGAIRGTIAAVLEAVYADLLTEVTLDLCFAEHKAARTSKWPATALPPAATGMDIFGLAVVKKVPERAFKCESCGQKASSSKFAAHLEKCTGKGGRASARRARGTATAVAATQPVAQAKPSPPQWEDDAEMIAYSSSSKIATTVPMVKQLGTSYEMSPIAPSPSPSIASAGHSPYPATSAVPSRPHSSSSGAAMYSDTSVSPFGVTVSPMSMTHASDSSPFYPNGYGYPSAPGLPVITQQGPPSWPSNQLNQDAMAGHKRKAVPEDGKSQKPRY